MAPRELRKRKGYVRGEGEGEVIEANPDATGVELHKDSRFYASWQSFKDNNPVVNKFVDIRVKVQLIIILTKIYLYTPYSQSCFSTESIF